VNRIAQTSGAGIRVGWCHLNVDAFVVPVVANLDCNPPPLLHHHQAPQSTALRVIVTASTVANPLPPLLYILPGAGWQQKSFKDAHAECG